MFRCFVVYGIMLFLLQLVASQNGSDALKIAIFFYVDCVTRNIFGVDGLNATLLVKEVEEQSFRIQTSNGAFYVMAAAQ